MYLILNQQASNGLPGHNAFSLLLLQRAWFLELSHNNFNGASMHVLKYVKKPEYPEKPHTRGEHAGRPVPFSIK